MESISAMYTALSTLFEDRKTDIFKIFGQFPLSEVNSSWLP